MKNAIVGLMISISSHCVLPNRWGNGQFNTNLNTGEKKKKANQIAAHIVGDASLFGRG